MQAAGSGFIYMYPQVLQKLLETEAKIPRSQDLHYRKWLEVVANVLSINIATHMHLNTNNSIIWTFCYLGVTEARNDSLPLDQALKDPHRIDYVLRHLHRISNAIK